MMGSKRLFWMLAAVALLAGLVWFDRSGNTPGESGNSAGPGAIGSKTGGSGTRAKTADGAPKAAKPRPNPWSDLDIKSLKQTVERPLFVATRRPPAPPPPPPPPPPPRKAAPPPPPPPVDTKAFDVVGISSSGERAIALLKQKATGKRLRVEAGDIVDGWQIDKIEERHVVMSKRGTQVRLRLFREE